MSRGTWRYSTCRHRGEVVATRHRPTFFMVIACVLAASIAAGGAPDPDTARAACVVRGPLIVNSANEVRFSAKGLCGPFSVSIEDTVTSFHPQWTGGCNHGPGPFPRLYLLVRLTDLSGAEVGRRATVWDFPDLVVGNDRFVAPYATTRVLIRDWEYGDHGSIDVGGIAGHGLLLTRLLGSCNVTSRSKAKATVVFVLHDSIEDLLTL